MQLDMCSFALTEVPHWEPESPALSRAVGLCAVRSFLSQRLRGTTGSSAARGVGVCAHLSTTFMLASARADPVAKQRWRAFSEHSPSILCKALRD